MAMDMGELHGKWGIDSLFKDKKMEGRIVNNEKGLERKSRCEFVTSASGILAQIVFQLLCTCIVFERFQR